MKKTTYFLNALLLVFLMNACVSPQKLVEKGNYDEAIKVAVKRLSGKKNKKVKYVQALELAFAKANTKDLAEANQLKNFNRPQNWVRVLDIYEQIKWRQNKIQPLLPLIDKEGIKANFRFVRVEGLIEDAQNKTVEYYYNDGKRLLAAAKKNKDKIEARKAHAEFSKIKDYRRGYKDADKLAREAFTLGTTHILYDVRNESNLALPKAMLNDLKRINVKAMQGPWQVYHVGSTSNIKMDYRIVMNVTNAIVGESLVKEREYEESKTVIDGWEYVLDDRGNVAKDTLGNDLKVDRKVIVKARILEIYQHKTATISARIDILDDNRNELVDSHYLTSDAVFENYASTFQGDKRALSKDTKNRLGNKPVDFPTNEEMLFDAAATLKPLARRKIAKARL